MKNAKGIESLAPFDKESGHLNVIIETPKGSRNKYTWQEKLGLFELTGVLAAPGAAGLDAVRAGALYNYNMFAYIDGPFLQKAADYINKGGNPKELKAAGIVPNLMKRGAVRSVYDGRYVYARYFSPKQHNRPTTMEEIHRFNDVELYDTASDPLEMNNLARSKPELLLAMNEKLNRLIDDEVGEDRGQMLPGGIEAGWEVTAETMAP